MLVCSVVKFLPCGYSTSRGGNSCFAFLVAKYWVVFGMSCEWRFRSPGTCRRLQSGPLRCAKLRREMLRLGDRGVVLWVQSVFVRSMIREVGLVVVFGPSRVGIVAVGSYGHLGVCGVHLFTCVCHGRFGILQM